MNRIQAHNVMIPPLFTLRGASQETQMPSKKPRHLILLDYDGTLLPLKRRMDQAFLPPGTRQVLQRLARRHKVVFVTGRDLRDFQRLAGPFKGTGKIGTHGIESSGILGLHLAPNNKLKQWMEDRKRLVVGLHTEFATDQGLFLQVKRYALSLHFPHQKQDEETLRARFRSVIRRLGTKGLWEFQTGRHMIDLRPRGFSKQKAVRALLRLYPNDRAIYAGDDLSDLPVLKFLKGRGLRIGIGPVISKNDCDLWFPKPATFINWLRDF
jgi:trehalose 6-phosphate phosphatase